MEDKQKTCETCMHYTGGGDWNLCCDLKYDLCYRYTPACEKYEETDLKPCPFCGNREPVMRRIPEDGKNLFHDRYVVQCEYTGDEFGCGAESGYGYTYQHAASLWNTRKLYEGI